MATTLTTETLRLPGARLGPESSVPPVARMRNLQQTARADVDEDDGLFLGYGFIPGSFPYPYQDNYNRTLEDCSFRSVVLENCYLKAVFVPELGGRLWSLYDKEAHRDLLFTNPVFRPGNLAIRNAWFSGGVEFNCGPVGHHPHTCEPIGCAELALPDGTPVLRLYEFERIRSMAYQMDFFLPEESRFLYARMRLCNETPRVIPAYWWSNIAVPAYSGGRVLVSADEAFSQNKQGVYKLPVAPEGGPDISYPEHTPDSHDYFWNVRPGARKYIAHVGQDGYGLLQCSTDRLQGRKLFVWGQYPGSRRWQEFLSGGAGQGYYHELQAGLGRTQYECVPMPPHTSWEWLEAYGAVQLEPAEAHGSWPAAYAAAERFVNGALPAGGMELLLRETRNTAAKRPAMRQLSYGSGWGTLENIRRAAQGEPPLSPHLDFGPLHAAQEYWRAFLETGDFPGSGPIPSYMLQPEWVALLKASAAGAGHWSWAVHTHLGLCALAADDLDGAHAALSRALSLHAAPEAFFGMAVCEELSGRTGSAADYALRAAVLRPHDRSYARAAAERMHKAGQHGRLLQFLAQRPELSEDGRTRMYQASALLHTGQAAQARRLLCADGGLELPDLREGETTITELWLSLKDLPAENGETETLPSFFDFRLHTAPEEENT